MQGERVVEAAMMKESGEADTNDREAGITFLVGTYAENKNADRHYFATEK